MSAVCRLLRAEVQEAAGPDQLAVGVPDGCAKVYQASRLLCEQSPERDVLARDIAGAHQHLNRKFAARELEARCPRLLQPFLTWYGRNSTHVWRTASNEIQPVPSRTGVDQGDPLANPVFCVSMASLAQALKQDLRPLDPNAAVFQFADDLAVVTKTNLFATVATSNARHWANAGLAFKASKDACWSLDPNDLWRSHLLPQSPLTSKPSSPAMTWTQLDENWATLSTASRTSMTEGCSCNCASTSFE